MRTIKKSIAVLSSLAAAAVVTASAMSAFAFESVDLDDRASELKTGLNLIADEVYAEPGETVNYSVYIKNNTGYAVGGIGLIYDEALKPIIKSSNDRPDLTYSDGSYMLSKTTDYSAAEHRLGVGTMGDENCTRDGIIFTAKFVVPADAKENDEFKLTLDIDSLLDYKTDPVSYSTVDGWIRIRTKQVTTTVTTVTTSPTTPTTSVTVPTTEKPVTTDKETTPSTAPTTPSTAPTTVTTTITTDISTVSNTSKTDRDDPNKGEPTTASRQNNGGQTTKAPASSSTTKTTATRTGDAGVGVAAAALMLSAATAVTFKRKKH